MDRRYPDAAAIVKKMKDGARANPWVPLGIAPQERYHHFPNGLSLCLTVDVLSKEGFKELARRFGLKPPGDLGEGGQFWHLSMARVGSLPPAQEEVEFWRRAFFEEEPIIEMRGLLTGLHTRHFFWRYQ